MNGRNNESENDNIREDKPLSLNATRVHLPIGSLMSEGIRSRSHQYTEKIKTCFTSGMQERSSKHRYPGNNELTESIDIANRPIFRMYFSRLQMLPSCRRVHLGVHTVQGDHAFSGIVETFQQADDRGLAGT